MMQKLSSFEHEKMYSMISSLHLAHEFNRLQKFTVMIEIIKGLPSHIVGFRAKDLVTKEDYEQVVFPAAEELVKRTDELNYVFVFDTPFKNMTAGAWWKDTMLSLMKMSKRHRAAIITDSEGANRFTDIWGIFTPGEFKGFLPSEYDEAVAWAAELH